ncbi:MAG: M14 family metallopeptidase, partial [Balneolaceae bacterium]|nr:M14 family metallopeptidase [Balneolaceae bacterium]
MNTIRSAILVLAGLLCLTATASAQKAVPSPAEYLGYELGDRWTPHHKVTGYFKQVAAASPMVEWRRYGTTNEGRELMIVTVSSNGNLARKEEIRINNLKRAGLLQGAPTEDTTAIVWLSYNVHGNEASSSEAAMMTLYELVRPNNARAKKWLRNTLVIIDPMLNPDGRERYVHWYRQTVGEEPDPSVEAREHHEPWPGGRTNHYYFDLNRDWAWLTQKESRHRIRLYQSWLPHVHVDYHEQAHNSPYYFAPAAEPFHRAITGWQQQFQYTIGENHAGYFDRNNWLYFTREIFDLFYPSYGDTYPIFNGSIGMTYEQAGQVGLEIVQSDGDTLTLRDRLLHHHTTGISTVEIVSEHAERVVREFGKYYRDARSSPAGEYKTYVITGDNNPDKLRNLFELLDRHKVRYGKAPRSGTYSGYDYRTGETRRVTVSGDDYLIGVYQPKSVLARIFFEPRPELSDSVTYDITAWEQHYAFGLEGYALTQRIDPVPTDPPGPMAADGRFSGEPYAYLAEWKSQTDLKLLSYLLGEGVLVRFATEQFVIGGRSYRPGTLIITRSGNTALGSRFDRIVQRAAGKYQQPLVPVSTGFVDAGPDFGSEAVRYLEKPRIALLSGRGTAA